MRPFVAAHFMVQCKDDHHRSCMKLIKDMWEINEMQEIVNIKTPEPKSDRFCVAGWAVIHPGKREKFRKALAKMGVKADVYTEKLEREWYKKNLRFYEREVL